MEIMKGIKNIIFDLCGALLNINTKKTIEALGQLGMEQLIGDKNLTYNREVSHLMEQWEIEF